jgi:ABC-2 type transport system permease protein
MATHAATTGVTPAGADRAERLATVTRNVRTIGMVWVRELIRLKRMPTRIISGLAQPLLFLLVMGAGMSKLVSSQAATAAGGALGPAADFDYQVFLFPGILAMSVITSALFSSVAIVWDREFGFMREMLVAPVSRTSLVLGKAVGGGSVAVAQGIVLIVFAPVVGVHLTVGRVVAMLLALLLLAFALTAFGIVLSSRMTRMESFQMVMALVMQPMIFLSGAVFPLQNLPGWLAVLCRLNPATYGVDLCRRAILDHPQPLTFGSQVVPIWVDVLVVVGLGSAMLAVAVRLFSKIE